LLTPAEISEFTAYTNYEEMMDYIGRVQASSREMKMGFYGETWEGRKLPYLVMSRPTITQPWEALVSGKPIAVIHGNVHGGERTLRESLLILLREFATPGTPANDLLDDLVVVMVPQVNPDGFETGNRGTRGNSWGIDLNRDYVKLEQIEIAGLVKNIHNTWRPHVIIDGHNGGSRPYNLCYQATSNATPFPGIDEMCDFEVFPYINKRMEDNGFKSFYYTGGNEERWNGGGYEPRISRNYAAFINSIGILFESPGQEMETGVAAGKVGYLAVLEFMAQNPDKVMGVVNRARRETIAMGENPGREMMVQMNYVAEDFPVVYEIRDSESPTGYRTIADGKLMTKPNVLATRPLPYAYILPRDARDAVAMLQRHGITVEVLRESRSLEVQAYVVGDIRYRSEYNHAASVEVQVAEVATFERNFPAGSFVVPTAQMHGRLVQHMLEPETNDNVVKWNTMDAWLPRPQGARRGGRGRGGDVQAAAGRGAAGGAAQVATGGAGERGGQRAAGAGQGRRGERGAGGQRGRGGRGGRGGGGGRNDVVPIFKLMTPTALPTNLLP
jgi:hypothetical protein